MLNKVLNYIEYNIIIHFVILKVSKFSMIKRTVKLLLLFSINFVYLFSPFSPFE